MREFSLAPQQVYRWVKIPLNISWGFSCSHSGLWDCRCSQTTTRAGKGCHRNTCSRVSVQEFHFAPFQLHFLLWQHSLDVSTTTLAVVTVLLSMHWTWTVCCWLLMCDCEVQLSSWHKGYQSFEHAVRLCTIPLVLYYMLSAVMLREWGVYIVRNTIKLHAFLNSLFYIDYLRHVSTK